MSYFLVRVSEAHVHKGWVVEDLRELWRAHHLLRHVHELRITEEAADIRCVLCWK
jgi:hypothetical protein